jgi:hypothetical protein
VSVTLICIKILRGSKTLRVEITLRLGITPFSVGIAIVRVKIILIREEITLMLV